MKIVEKSLKIVSFLLIIFFILLLIAAIFGNRSTTKVSPLIGKKAPEINIDSFDGKKLMLSDFHNKIVLLNFWASWCMPCRQEAPELDSSWNKYRNTDVIFIGINILDEKNNARNYLDQFKPDYLNGFDTKGTIALDYGVTGVPETFFINKQGTIIDKYIGPLSEKMIDKYIEKTRTDNS